MSVKNKRSRKRREAIGGFQGKGVGNNAGR